MHLESVVGRMGGALAILLATALVSACAPAREDGAPAPRQAILILLDAARADRFGFAGYARDTTPRLDAMAKEGLISLDHFAPDTHTRGALPALFYSRSFTKALFPTSDAVPYAEPASLMRRLDDEAFSFVRALGEDGFATAAISAHSWLKPGTPFAAQFDTLVDLTGELDRYAPPARHVIDRALPWIESHRDDDYFLYLHLMDTHFPHAFGPDAQHFFGPGRQPPSNLDGRHGTWAARETIDAEARRYLDALYDGSLRYTDRQIARLMSFLERQGLAQDTLVVVTSDHGEHLFESPGRFAHGGPWLDPVARIPLLVHYPGRVAPGRIPGFTGLVDVAPTVLSLLDVPVPAGKSTDGRDLVAIAEGRAERRKWAIGPLGIRSRKFKLIVRDPAAVLDADPGGQETTKTRTALFDLARDPNEREDRSALHPDRANDLRAAYRDRMGPRWRRFVSATNHVQPESAFAIGARHFEIESERVLDVKADRNASHTLSGKAASVWRRSRHWKDDWIEGSAGAPPLAVSFVLPNGEYEVSARISGTGAIALADAPPSFVAASASRATTGRVDLGRVRVEGETFRSRLHPPAGTGTLRVHHFGFRPVGLEERNLAREERHLEQLRALGYVR